MKCVATCCALESVYRLLLFWLLNRWMPTRLALSYPAPSKDIYIHSLVLFLCSPKQANKMSVSVQQILADAKRLAGRLKDHDSSADLLLSQAQAMFCQVDAMKEVFFLMLSTASFCLLTLNFYLHYLVPRGACWTKHSCSPTTTLGSHCKHSTRKPPTESFGKWKQRAQISPWGTPKHPRTYHE